MPELASPPPVGIFDSGVGGLSVLRAVFRELPGVPVIYLADQAHVPYGSRSLAEVSQFSAAITRYLLAQGVTLIIVACNTASAAALHTLRQTFPKTPFVGMEPAVKPAAETTRSGAVGVLATPATFQGVLYASVVERFANGVKLLQHTCPGLVSQIEAGHLDSLETQAILRQALEPMLLQGIDTIVLGCTHYPFVIPQIEQIAGPGIRVIDPAPAVARQARRLIEMTSKSPSPVADKNPPNDKTNRFLTTGDPDRFQTVLAQLLNVYIPVEKLYWQDAHLTETEP